MLVVISSETLNVLRGRDEFSWATPPFIWNLGGGKISKFEKNPFYPFAGLAPNGRRARRELICL